MCRKVGRKGRKNWQERVWRINDEKILKALAEGPLTKAQLHEKAELAWNTITPHLEASEEIISEGRSQKGRRFYLKSNYIPKMANLREDITRLQKIIELLRIQQEDTREYEYKQAQTRLTLKGKELYERLDEIHWDYLSQKQNIIQTLKKKGINFPEWEKRVDKAITTFKEMKNLDS